MRFGAVPVADALGAVLAHSTRVGGRALPKGRVLSADDLAALANAGVTDVIVAQLAEGELGEDAAAGAIAAALAGSGLRVDPARTGRANIRAVTDGLVCIHVAAIARANAVDEAITIATVPADHPARASEIVATVKVIPFAVARTAVDAVMAALATDAPRSDAGPVDAPGSDAPRRDAAPVDAPRSDAPDSDAPRSDAPRVDAGRDAVSAHRAHSLFLAPWRPRRAGLVLTQFPTTPVGVLDRAAAAQRTRLARLGSELVRELRVAHDVAAVAAAIEALAVDCDPILVLGASAIIDRRDVIPAALESAGGSITRFGMPVDPGNLLLHGTLRGASFIGLPGCARSLARSGCDWVLERAVAGVPIDSASIAALGVGGLLDESTRPSPREEAPPAIARIAAVVLAAGRSSRMGDNKLLVELDGQPLVRHAVMAALASRARPVVVVTGNEADRVRGALLDLDVRFVHNPDFATGMASSLRAGIATVGDAAGALVCLGDMPRVTAAHLDALVAAFDAAQDDGAIVVPTCERKRGNPVLWGRRHFASIATLSGDVGARALIEQAVDSVVWLAVDDPAILLDVDTPEALGSLRSEAR
ncbi:MAG: NTP transferase domain-containing protein [Kofleriaceae bacterium]